MKLGKRQTIALAWLAQQPWTASWWGGRPHTGWPVQMTGATFDALHRKKFVSIAAGERFDRIVTITAAGRDALGAP